MNREAARGMEREKRESCEMGNCWGAPAEDDQAPTSTGNLSPGTSQTSQPTSLASSGYVSSKSPFSGTSSEKGYPNGKILPTPNLREFSFQELKTATRNFKADTLLGEGGFGKVYKGWIEATKQAAKNGSGLAVAIKKLNSESCQGLEEWQSEVNFLGRLSHPNLVKLLGYCWEDDELLLVYEYMQRGSLENHLFGRGSAVQPLSWELRLKIAIGAARGLAFLHTSNDVIYRDIKASNILLDSSYNAKISDFGLAKLGPSASQSHVTTRVIGTYGYAAPEYLATGHLYVKSDVYGFGVVLVELLTGLRAVDTSRPSGKQSLVDWIKPYLSDKKKLKHIIDTRFEGKYPSKAAIGIAQLALQCLAQEPKNRPSMQEVLETLEKFEGMNVKPRVSRRNSSGTAVRPHQHRRPNGIRSHENSLQAR